VTFDNILLLTNNARQLMVREAKEAMTNMRYELQEKWRRSIGHMVKRVTAGDCFGSYYAAENKRGTGMGTENNALQVFDCSRHVRISRGISRFFDRFLTWNSLISRELGRMPQIKIIRKSSPATSYSPRQGATESKRLAGTGWGRKLGFGGEWGEIKLCVS
jgi:hypothetical protein